MSFPRFSRRQAGCRLCPLLVPPFTFPLPAHRPRFAQPPFNASPAPPRPAPPRPALASLCYLCFRQTPARIDSALECAKLLRTLRRMRAGCRRPCASARVASAPVNACTIAPVIALAVDRREQHARAWQRHGHRRSDRRQGAALHSERAAIALRWVWEAQRVEGSAFVAV
jgi:hypothetical protein